MRTFKRGPCAGPSCWRAGAHAGLCAAHAKQRGIGAPLTALPHPFWSNVNKHGPTLPSMDSPCWVWTGGAAPFGYGRIKFQGERDAHRVSWALHNGAAGKAFVLHRCDNAACVRPDHLFLGSHADNMGDKAKKGRVPTAKLTRDDVLAIRALVRSGNHPSLRSIARQHGVDHSQIVRLLKGEAWTHVEAA
jgi:hypothetical protein